MLHPVWLSNYAHSATATLAWIYNNINQSSHAALAEHARQGAAAEQLLIYQQHNTVKAPGVCLARRLVVRTPHGWAMPPFMQPLFQPLLRHPVTTFAE